MAQHHGPIQVSLAGSAGLSQLVTVHSLSWKD